MRSQRIVLVGAFCGGVFAGGIAAALSDFGFPAATQDEVPRQAVEKASVESSGVPRASGIHDGGAALKTKVVSAAVVAVGRSREFVAPPAVPPGTARRAIRDIADEPAVEVAKAAAPTIAPTTALSPVQGFGDEPQVEMTKAAAPVIAPSPAENVAAEPAVEMAKAVAPDVAPSMAPNIAPSLAESVAAEPTVELAKAAAPAVAPAMAPGSPENVAAGPAIEIANAAAPAIAPGVAPGPGQSVADETAISTAKAATWTLASLPPSDSAGKADGPGSAIDEPAVERDKARGSLVPDHPSIDEDELQLAMALAYASPDADVRPRLRRSETPDECLAAQICIDDYLWSLYEVTPKLDTNKETARIKVTVKRKGKLRTILKTIAKYVPADFTWKDPIAAQRGGMSLKDYVIGGMDRSFRVKLHNALRAMEAAGFTPGITSAFRDDYRQSIASGKKAASDSSYHGGSRRGGYGHGLAADLVSLKGDTRLERYVSSKELWKWIDEHEKELGIGRPYLDRDPPHVAPIDGKEYADKRGARSRIAGSAKSHRRVLVARSKTS